jgi:hypothetical protein
MKNMRLCLCLVLALLSGLAGLAHAEETPYDTAVGNWKSYEDIARWLDGNFQFDRSRLQTILGRVRQDGPQGLLAHKPAKTFESRSGYCTDSAQLAMDALNRINPAYQAKYVFVKNRAGPAQHWVTGFLLDGKIMVMDYGASPEWSAMRGVHGPYVSLKEYVDFLATLKIRGFAVDFVEWRDMPGQED